MVYLLDTCAFLSYTGLITTLPLGRAATKILLSKVSEIAISPSTAVELEYLHLKGRISFPGLSPGELLAQAADVESWVLHPLDLRAVRAVPALLKAGIKDPFDLLIASTALGLGMTVITCDQRLINCQLVRTIW